MVETRAGVGEVALPERGLRQNAIDNEGFFVKGTTSRGKLDKKNPSQHKQLKLMTRFSFFVPFFLGKDAPKRAVMLFMLYHAGGF